MRTDTELLILLRDRTDTGSIWNMLIHVVHRASHGEGITYPEGVRLIAIIDNHAPKRTFSTHDRVYIHYRMTPGKVKQRIRWINSLLKRIENGEQL